MAFLSHRSQRLSAALLWAGLTFGLTGPASAAPVRIATEGTLEVEQEDDFSHGQTRIHYQIREAATGRSFAVDFVGKGASGLKSGSKIRLRGDLDNNRLRVGLEAGALEVLADAPAVTGARRALVLVVNFSDSAVSCTDSAVGNIMFSGTQNIDAYYREVSNQLVSFPGDTDGNGSPDVFRVSIANSVTSATCDYNTWASNADAAATAAGINLSLYQHKVYVLPSNISACGWAGLANVGCSSTCRAWIKSCGTADIYGHELGHNLGMQHASYDTDNDGAIDATCPFNSLNGEYCDYSDMMGIGGVGYRWFNGPHLFQQGWHGAGKLQDIAGSASISLAPVELAPSSTTLAQIGRIAKTDSPGTYYYLTYRRALGYDATLRTTYVDKLSVHRWSGSGNTLFITALSDGQSFTDTANSLTVTLVGHDANSATVQVATACSTNTPQVVLTPSSLAGRSGTPLNYSVSVTNRDTASCGASTFDLSGNVPAGFTSSVTPSSLTLAGGASGTATLSATASAGTPSGAYSVGVSATDPALVGHAGSGGASAIVDDLTPNAVNNLAGTVSNRTRVTLTWTAPTDNGLSGVVQYEVYRNGALRATTSSTSYVDTGSRRTTYQYGVIAVDGAGNRSAMSNLISVTTK